MVLREGEAVDEDASAIPLPRSYRDEADTFKPEVMFLELVDNAIEATRHTEGTFVDVKLEEDAPDGPALLIEDTGRGMDLEQLKQYFRVGYTTSRLPQVPRDGGVLPFKHFINPHLNRFGRGCVAVFYWGDVVTIESEKDEQPAADNLPRTSYTIRFDYGAALAANSWDVPIPVTKRIVVDPSPGTRIRISQLRPSLLAKLRDPVFIRSMSNKICQAYHFYVHGFPPVMWDKLPAQLTRDSDRPTGRLTVNFFKESSAGCTISRDSSDVPHTDLNVLFNTIEEVLHRKPALNLCVIPMRYVPAGHPGPGEPGHGDFSHLLDRGDGDADGTPPANAPPTAQRPTAETPQPATRPTRKLTDSATGRGSGAAACGHEQQTPAGGVPSGRGRKNVVRGGAGPSSGAGGGKRGRDDDDGRASGSAATPNNVPPPAEQGTDRQDRPAEMVCDFQGFFVYLPSRRGQRVKPIASDGSEQCMFPFWSGKGMVDDQLRECFPKFVQVAADRAKSELSTMVLAYKLGDAKRLVGFVMASPDAGVHHHKSKLEGDAYQMLKGLGPKGQVLSGNDVPRLYTYVWPPADQAAAAGNFGAQASAATMANAAASRAAKRTGRTTRQQQQQQQQPGGGAAADAAGPSAAALDGQEGVSGWRQDLEEGWAAKMLVQSFACWQSQDEDGQVVGEDALTELTVDEPYDDAIPYVGQFLQQGQKYEFGAGYNPLECGEMVRLGEDGDPGLYTLSASDRQWRRSLTSLKRVHIVENYFKVGADSTSQHFAVLRPWRPSWAPKARATAAHVSRLQPVLALAHGGADVNSRKAEQRDLVDAWESELPHNVEFATKLSSTYDPTRMTVEAVKVILATSRTAAQARRASKGRKPKAKGGGTAAGNAGAGPSTAGPGVAAGTPGALESANMPGLRAYASYTPSATLLLERASTVEGGAACVLQRCTKVFKEASLTFELEGLLIAPGSYRIQVSVEEHPACRLLNPAPECQTIDHKFEVRPSQPADLRAFFASPSSTTRLGEPLPDLTVQLLDHVGAQVPFERKLMDALEASKAIDGADELTIKAAQRVDGDAEVRLARKATSISFSGDGLNMYVRGIVPNNKQELKRTSNEDGVKVAAGSIQVELSVGFRIRVARTHRLLAQRAGDSVPALTLCSGPPARLVLELGRPSWLSYDNPGAPLKACKGAVPDHDVVVQIVDAAKNPYHHLDGDPPVRVELRCKSGVAGGRPPVQLRRQGAGGRSLNVDSMPLSFGAGGDALTIGASDLLVTGMPGDKGTLEVVLLPQPAANGADGARGWPGVALVSHMEVKKVLLSVETVDAVDASEGGAPMDAAGGSIGGASGSAAAPPGQQQQHAAGAATHLKEYVMDSAARSMRRRNHPLQWVQLVQPADAGGGGLLQEAFEHRLEYTCGGPRTTYLRPNGEVLRSSVEVLRFVNGCLAPGAPSAYEQCFLLRPWSLQLGGLRVALADAHDDTVDRNFTATVKVRINERDANNAQQPLLVEEGKVRLPVLEFKASDFEEANGARLSRTASVRVVDAETQIEYGVFYVRQAPYPASLRLAPVMCDLLRGAEAVTAAPAVRGVLQELPGARAGGGGGLLQLRSLSGAVDAAVLMARGFAVVPEKGLPVRRGTLLRVPVVLVDQLGYPICVSGELRAVLAVDTLLEVETRSSRGLLPPRIEDWEWAEPPPPQQQSRGGPAPINYILVRLSDTPGATKLSIAYSPLHLATVGAHGVCPPMHIGLPLDILSGPLAVGGYVVHVNEPRGLQASSVEEHLEVTTDDRQLQQPLTAAPAQHRNVHVVTCKELCTINLSVQLQDEGRHPVSEAGAFELRASRLLGISNPSVIKSTDGGRVALPALRIGAGTQWRQHPKLLVLTPKSANFSHAAPLCVYVRVEPGRYPVTLELVSAGGMPPGGCIALTNEDIRPVADRGPGGPRLPLGFEVRVVSADGEPLRRDELSQLRLHYEEQVEDRWSPYTQLAVPPWTAGETGLYTVIAGQLPMPTLAGPSTWRLVAVYQGANVPDPSKRLPPLVVAQFTITAAPPCRLALDAASRAALGPLILTDAALALRPPAQPAGHLMDRWGNRSGPGPSARCCMELIARPLHRAAVGAVVEVLLGRSDVESGSGGFALPPCSLAVPSLQRNLDYELVLRLLAVPGAEAAAAAVLGAVEPLRVGTLYIATDSSENLRRVVAGLESEIESRQAQLDRAEGDVRGRRRELETTRTSLRNVLRALEMENVNGIAGGSHANSTVDQEVALAAQAEAAVGDEVRRLTSLLTAGIAGAEDMEEGAAPLRHAQGEYRAAGVLRIVERLMALFRGRPGVLGPLCSLGTVERRDTAQALAVLGYDPKLMVCAGRTATDEVKRVLANTPELHGVNVIDLTNPDLFSTYSPGPAAVDTTHPQKLLNRLGLGYNAQNQMDNIFHRIVGNPIGFAVNLVHLTPDHLEPRIQMGHDMANLRQTLWRRIFSDALVFERGVDIDEFRTNCRQHNIRVPNKLVALDGRGGYNLSGLGIESTMSRAASTWMSGVALAELTQLGPDGRAGGALDARLRRQQEALFIHTGRRNRLLSLGQEMANAVRNLGQQQRLVAEAEAVRAALGPHIEAELPELQEDLEQARESLQELEDRERDRQQQQEEGAAGGSPQEQGGPRSRPTRGRFGAGRGAAAGGSARAAAADAGAGPGPSSRGKRAAGSAPEDLEQQQQQPGGSGGAPGEAPRRTRARG